MAVIPNVVTHGLMALDVFNRLETSKVKEAIASYPRSFLLGSNGPDILFYYKVFPWQDQKLNKIIANYGSIVHEKNIDAFYDEMFLQLSQIKNSQRQEVLISYVAGHLLHWALDVLAHPFVFYRSGPLSGESEYWHYRYESMLDALMVTYYKDKKLSDVNVKKFVDVSEEERRYIATFYQQSLAKVHGIYVRPDVIESAIISFKQILTFLYDPHNLSTPIIQTLENKFAKPWAFSSHVVNSKIEAEYDVLNLKREMWCNPCDDTICSNQSFIDLYEESIDLGVSLLEAFEKVLKGERDNLHDMIQNRRYDSGLKSDREMKYFNPVYKK